MERYERNTALTSLEPRAFLESIPDFAYVFGERGQLVSANSAALEMLDMSEEKLRHMSLQELVNLVSVTDSGKPVATAPGIVERALQGEFVRCERRRIRRLDTRTSAELSISAAPLRNRTGKIVGALVIARDVTEFAMLQNRLVDTERHHAIGQMAAAMAHDFSNVLDTIGQASTLLENNQRPESEKQDMVHIIQTAVRRGSELISGVREYLRTGTGTTRPVDIRQVLLETIELTRPLWQRSGIHLSTELEPVGMVLAEGGDLRRVFTNLVINAIEAMPGGGELTIVCCEKNGRVMASVRDTGPGIAPEHQPRIFFPYFTTKPQGTGLGLSGAQKILMGLGGNVSFVTLPGKETTFTVELPLKNPRKKANRQPAA
ncbi:MAG: nitrogen regulation protein NR(II) [Candidatus Korobacteraceae bacterium]